MNYNIDGTQAHLMICCQIIKKKACFSGIKDFIPTEINPIPAWLEVSNFYLVSFFKMIIYVQDSKHTKDNKTNGKPNSSKQFYSLLSNHLAAHLHCLILD